MKATTILQQFKDFLLDVFFPKKCVGCGLEGTYLCFDCAGRIELVRTPLCPECGKIVQFGELCQRCKGRLGLKLDGLITAAIYEQGPTREMIHHLKYSGFLELAPMLSELIYLRLKYRLPKGDLFVVPVPLYRKREQKRGFNQAELLARYISERLDLHGSLALKRLKETGAQAKLSGEERRKNLIGAFGVADADAVQGKTILLVDDVATTLSTLNECAKVLKSAGAKKVWGVVVARG